MECRLWVVHMPGQYASVRVRWHQQRLGHDVGSRKPFLRQGNTRALRQGPVHVRDQRYHCGEWRWVSRRCHHHMEGHARGLITLHKPSSLDNDSMRIHILHLLAGARTKIQSMISLRTSSLPPSGSSSSACHMPSYSLIDLSVLAAWSGHANIVNCNS